MPWIAVGTLLVLIALGLTIWHGTAGRPPLWVPLLLVEVALLAGAVVTRFPQ